MRAAEVISFAGIHARQPWDTRRQQLHACFDQWLATLETPWHEPASTFTAVTATV
jgi:hypothetical protein